MEEVNSTGFFSGKFLPWLAQEIKDIETIGEWPCQMSCKFVVVIPHSDFPYCILSNEYFYFITCIS